MTFEKLQLNLLFVLLFVCLFFSFKWMQTIAKHNKLPRKYNNKEPILEICAWLRNKTQKKRKERIKHLFKRTTRASFKTFLLQTVPFLLLFYVFWANQLTKCLKRMKHENLHNNSWFVFLYENTSSINYFDYFEFD